MTCGGGGEAVWGGCGVERAWVEFERTLGYFWILDFGLLWLIFWVYTLHAV